MTFDFMADEGSMKSDSTAKNLRDLEEMARKNPNVTKRELKHIDALIKYSNGDFDNALLTWESILLGKSKMETN